VNTKDRHNMMRMAIILRKLASLAPMNPADIQRTANAARASIIVGLSLAGVASSMQYAEGQAAVAEGLEQAETLIEVYRTLDTSKKDRP
jgi:hypothetical protein